MRVFVAGATGVIGQYLVPSLVTAGHEVTGTTRSTAKAAALHAAGATPVIVDGLDRRAVLDAVKAAQPDVTGGAPGVYNVVDDDPAPVHEWLPYLAGCHDVKPLMHVPAWLGRAGQGHAA